MVNRTLIRLKVVQMLYSYLLTRSDFKLLPQPEKQTRDSRAAYSMYIDFLLFILELSGYCVDGTGTSPLRGIPANKSLSSTKMAKALASDSDIREIILRNSSSIKNYDSAIPTVYSEIAGSSILKDYSKIKQPQIKDDVDLWCVVLETIFAKSQTLVAAARKREDFTQNGFDNAIKMCIRTLRDYSDTASSLTNATSSLQASLRKAYELYFSIFALIIELTKTQEQRLEDAKDKFIPTAADLNPNTRLIDNRFVAAIIGNPQYQAYIKENPISWEGDIYLVRDLLDAILASDIYAAYINETEPGFKNDVLFWRHILKNIILPSETFEETLESKSVFWNDDLEIMSTFVDKTMKRWAEAESDAPGFLPIFKDEEDARFGIELFTDAIKNREKYREYIDSCIDTANWDSERIAFMDVIIMTAILSELLNFPLIPIAVTMNEYLDIANRYSTVKSGQFISGVMYTLIKKLQDEGILQKQ